ncbi:Rieske (2Fe-2S) protein [Pseudonocardia oceani]|nr:Rieske (2Fe-2S) protein [Pseudonocardia oceani]
MTDTATARATMPKGTPHVVATVGELPPGSRKIVEIDGRSIGVLNVDGRLHALMNNCPHHGAPLCEGVVKGTMEDSAPHEYSYGRHDEYLVCPWHGYEFRLDTGRPLLDMGRLRVRVYDVRAEGDHIVLYV